MNSTKINNKTIIFLLFFTFTSILFLFYFFNVKKIFTSIDIICSSTPDWIRKFNESANKIKSEKISYHHLEYMYGIHLGPLRMKPVNLLEIGLGCTLRKGPGRSITLWREFLPKANITILEYDKTCAEAFRSKLDNLYIGDQSDFNILKQLSQTGPYDIIIDDGGHTRKQQINSLIGLWPHVKAGGFYIIEDIFTSLMDMYNDKPTESAIDVIHQLIVLLNDGSDINYPTKFPNMQISEYSKEIVKDLLFVSCFKRACILNKKF